MKIIFTNDSEIQTKYEQFVKNFDMLDALYRNEAIPAKILLVILSEQRDKIFDFILSISGKNRFSLKAKELFNEMCAYMNDLRKEITV